ncbi:hypothetical protein RR48_03330 [Papilio machaon]|uniref:Uncharacterized protein n=1 Tax=Papilio machaon TaxID=76193 RepID=A0A0N1PHU0_PAPMA|nr:hypothetical protein RR48_03330 [Papilio machaon]
MGQAFGMTNSHNDERHYTRKEIVTLPRKNKQNGYGGMTNSHNDERHYTRKEIGESPGIGTVLLCASL